MAGVLLSRCLREKKEIHTAVTKRRGAPKQRLVEKEQKICRRAERGADCKALRREPSSQAMHAWLQVVCLTGY